MGFTFFLAFLAFGVGLVSTSPVVKESVQVYSCCEKAALPLKFDEGCEYTLSVNNTNFAHFDDQKLKTCSPPCQKLENGQMILDSCVDVDVSKVCPSDDYIEEEIISCRGSQCSRTSSHHSSDGLLLLVLMTAGWFLPQG